MKHKKIIVGLMIVAAILFISYFVYVELQASKEDEIAIYPGSEKIEDASYITTYALQKYTMDGVKIPDDIQDLLSLMNVTVYGVNNATGQDIINWYMTANSGNAWLLCENYRKDTTSG